MPDQSYTDLVKSSYGYQDGRVDEQGRVSCVEPRGEYNSIAFDKDAIKRLAERIATRCDYPSVDRECLSVARKIASECDYNFTGIALAYAELEKNEFFVRVAGKANPGWQIRQVVAQYKRRGVKKTWISKDYEGLVNK